MRHRWLLVTLTFPLCAMVVGAMACAGARYPDVGYLVAAILGLAGCMVPRRLVAHAALAIILLTLSLRVLGVRENQSVEVLELPSSQPARLLDAIIDERYGTVPMAQGMVWLDRFRDDPEPDLADILRTGYARMNEAGIIATPAPTTYLGRHTPEAFDAIVVNPRGPTRDAVVFLHGYAGNFTLYCWHLAAAIEFRARVLCPSSGIRPRWSNRDGTRTVLTTLSWARANGAERIWLAGLSDGAVGVARLAPRLPALAGLVLISGSAPEPPPVRTPVLVVHGKEDPMSSAAQAAAYARAATRLGTYVPVQGGHFVFLSKFDIVAAALHHWMQAQRQTYDVAATIHADDMYNFNPGAHNIATGVADAENGRFEVGWATNF